MKVKNWIKYLFGICILTQTLIGCKNEDGIIPVSVNDLRYESTPGRIVLRWTTPENSNIRYVQVKYYDPLLKQDVLRTASAFADSLEIPETRAKYGDYTFVVKSVSETDDSGEEHTLVAKSQPASKTWTTSLISLSGDKLKTNAQEPSEGNLSNLVDNNTNTFFHTAWSVDIPGPHYITIELPSKIEGWWQFGYSPRNNPSNKPTNFDLFGSNDGNNWTLIKNFTKDKDKLPVDAKTSFVSERLNAEGHSFSHLKLSVNETNSGTVFWTMSEFKVYSVSLIDPEADEKEVE